MSSESPNSLTLSPSPESTKMSKTPLYIAIFALFVLAAVLYYSINIAHVEEEKREASRAKISETEEPLWLVEGSGLTLNAKKEQTSGVVGAATEPAPSHPTPLKEPIVVVRDAKPTHNAEAEQLQRRRTQSFLAALSAPLLSKKVNDSTKMQSSNTPINVTMGDTRHGQQTNRTDNTYDALAYRNTNSENSYDPRADQDKENFFARTQTSDNEWILNNTRTAGQPLELKTGTVIPSAMITGVNSDLPGTLIAQVSQNVFDTATGQNLLVPQGSKLFGMYDSRVVYGQSRVLVAWNRLMYPDGSSITLPSMPGADMTGSAGFEDQVDNHYFRIFGSAVLMSLILGGTSYAIDTLSDSDTDDDTSLQSQMTVALAQQLGQTTTQLLQQNLSIKPTLEIRPGYQFNIVLTKDIVFEQPYTAWRK